MDKPHHPNVIRTWVVNRTQAHGRPIEPAKTRRRKPAPDPRKPRRTGE